MRRGNKLFTTILMTLACLCSYAQKWTQLPASFKHTQKNILVGGEYLDSALAHALDSQGIKIMQIGDSHVKGKAFPNSIEATLRTSIPNLHWSYYGINGAVANRFTDNDMITRVANQKPNIVIISFGTNESHSTSYNESQHSQELMRLIVRLEKACPGVRFILTTPPGSYLRQRSGSYRNKRGRRRYTYSHSRNETTPRVAKNIMNFAKTYHITAWDLYNIAGGELYACTNWKDANLMNTDQIHYTVEGYNIMGKLLAEAIIKDYWIRIAQ
ncbi:MAG: hypothetical protein K6E54_03520 [Bacteroidaceae bacterium]|nr:hypothetical protein [Bacteroidaceae bacterium]